MPAQTAMRGDRDVRPNRSNTYGGGGNGKNGKKAAKRAKAPLWTKILTTFGVILALVGVGGIVVVKYFLNQLTSNIETTSSVLDNDGLGNKTVAAGKLPDGAMNMLMLGLDTRTGWGDEQSRSDTILILHITASHDQAYMISIPRDTVAKIPADDEMGFRGTTDKINSAYFFGSQKGRGWQGGAKLATKAVHELTGIEFDGVMVIDFNGFKGILEAMGGVHLCVDKRMWSSHYVVNNGKVEYAHGADPKSPPRNALWFEKGCRTMQPWEALEFSRLRHSTNGDYDRQRHQQQLLRAMAKKASSSGVMGNPTKVSKILAAAGKSLRMDTHGVPVDSFIFGLKGLAAGDLIPIKTNGGTFAQGENGGEGITDDTRKLFEATSADRLPEFLGRHPEMLINDATANS
ncbi:LCP family protein [Actinoplanes sp. LDG1-06]|uniref:LCP family protein n=1 Tax=Paractinoplanes ovalisporus TaxID=2810368 RepID=A0ABS2AEY5_9ACTN|nr:LCP family protein [Actinoplanes ovalisporus]MBM2618403.1 LCP family protein [Actinoplanes ovalisporus]